MGDSGQNANPIVCATTITQHIAFVKNKLLLDPKVYTKNVPNVTLNWKEAKRVPRISFEAISPIYSGTKLQ